MLSKMDHRQLLKELYSAPRKEPVVVQVPAMNFLRIAGQGKPDEDEFQQAAATIYPVAYTLKFMIRAACSVDYHVMPMEVCWVLVRQPKKVFTWTMQIMQPELVTVKQYLQAVEQVRAKNCPPLLDRLRFESVEEGPCAQVMHVGPYQGMNATYDLMAAVVRERGYSCARDTHDIYLNDVRKTRPENLKAIIRAAVVPAGG